MKVILHFSFLFLLCLHPKAQNELVLATPENTAVRNEAREVAPAQPSIILMTGVMKEKEVKQIIVQKNNASLNRLVRKSELEKKLRCIGFAGIPAGLLGAFNLAAASGAGNSRLTPVQLNAGIGCMALSAACFSAGIYFNHAKTKHYNNAIEKYNRFYN